MFAIRPAAALGRFDVAVIMREGGDIAGQLLHAKIERLRNSAARLSDIDFAAARVGLEVAGNRLGLIG